MDFSTPRTALALFLTAVIPGSGHFLLKRWWDGAAWFVLSIAVTAFGWLALDVSTLGDLLAVETLRRVLIVNVLLAIARMAALIDLALSSGAHMTWLGTAATLGVLLLMLVPHAWAHRTTATTIDLLEDVFVADPRPTTAVLAAGVESRTTVESDGDQTAYRLSPVERDAPKPLFGDRGELGVGTDGRFTVLLLGTDAGYGRDGERSDSIQIVSFDPETMQTAMFGIPRNWGGLPMPNAWPGPDVHPDMANTIYQYGWTHADVFTGVDDPGAAAAKVVFGNLLGLEVDHYIKVNMEGFVAVVDAMGGLDVNVTFEVDNEFSLPAEAGYTEVDLDEGVQTLTGLEAMGYARSRKTSNDYHRMGRQRCMIVAMAQQMTPADLLLNYGSLARAIGDHVSTDIPLSMVPTLIDLASQVDTGAVETVTFVPPLFVDGGDGFGHRKPHIERVRAAVADALSTAVDGADGVTTSAEACEL